ncbi:probable inactive histone-lysine N-methyltransferase SUVR1 isoform X1 [Dendrobium catenatum]|uniref:probable inactive histone-lysine N-methyltransferase SUVR1 isoform X1 n=1 Tax=Dendrobium catenatum TaxID=906689 RepID=UPI00109F4281|nr:probable inactive histone-lysine N-methyltransferase SUVR1 isoform X1 [Dendrobium catenatum]XP_028555665.1 probable inactive histone-lysine N-methyltransferase SUVR1 isoform X1 [Dendrobium catenatum]
MAPSAQLQRAQAAVKAMKLIGFDQAKAKAVLKKLLKVYENNWEYIEAENYRLLADSILDDQESVDPEVNETDAAASAAPEVSRKRLRHRQEDSDHFPLTVEAARTSPQRPTLVRSPEDHPTNFRGKMIKPVEAQCPHDGEGSFSSPHAIRKNGLTTEKAPQNSHNCPELSPISGRVVPRMTRSSNPANVPYFEKGKSSSLVMQERDKHQPCGTSGNLICYKEPKMEPDTEVPRDIVAVGFSSNPDMSVDEVPCYISDNYVPLSLPSPHGTPSGTAANHGTAQKGAFRWANASSGLTGANSQDAPINENEKCLKVLVQKEITNTDIASSITGEVKLSLTYSSDSPDFKMPSIESIFKMVEDRCLKSYKILKPDFSLMNLMKDICQCTVDLAAESSKDEQEAIKVTPLLEPLKRAHSPNPSHGMVRRSSAGSLDLVPLEIPIEGLNSHGGINGIQENSAPESSSHNVSQSLAIIPQEDHTVSAPHPLHDENDIAKGEERVRISLVNELTSEKFPAYFHYIARNAVYQNAHVNFSLARIDDEDCCLNCFGDCLSVPIPCACTRETGGEFAYTMDGLLKAEFLNECISMNRDPDKHHHIYCKDCPIEKSKNEHTPEACKGHLVRKFIKECWIKCGCSKQCGNRVVQRGISRNLQVFFVADVKGWGLRTLEELPRGAFVCEYVGEILTNIELYDRTIQKTGGARHTYPVLLDADWGSEAGLRDEEALCLDATFFGNVGRFVNHRCFDANLVEVPVEWETPDHHYYHLAFFTTRKVEALEELTWDYGIDFDDSSHPIKAFKCLCGSRFCRDRVRSKVRRQI